MGLQCWPGQMAMWTIQHVIGGQHSDVDLAT
jgi:hypothetical protein